MLGDRFKIKNAEGNPAIIQTTKQDTGADQSGGGRDESDAKTSTENRRDGKKAGPSSAWGDMLYAFIAAGCRLVKRIGKAALFVLKPFAHAARAVAPLAKKALVVMTTKKDKETGERHFNRKKALMSVSMLALWAATAPIQGMGLYYYSTLKTYEDVYIPDAAVFINQQRVEPGKRSMLSPREEIYTVMGKHVRKDGTVEPVRFDIDFNPYFFFWGDAMRPDLAASKLNSQSPYGVKAKLKVTGIYGRLPRSLRLQALRWLDFRSEIVKIEDVIEVSGLPPFVKTEEDAKEWMGKPVRPSLPKGVTNVLPTGEMPKVK